MPPSRHSARAPLGKKRKGRDCGLAAGSGAYGAVELDLEGPPAGAPVDASAWLRKTAHWLENSNETDPVRCLTRFCECEDDFRARRIKAPIVLIWLVLQILGAIFQAMMASEISGHLQTYENALAENCGPQHIRDDICLGPSWEMSFSQVFDFPPTMSSDDMREFDFVIPADHSIAFNTNSQPPTFLLGVEPLPPHETTGWKLSLLQEGHFVPATPPIYGHGKRYQVVSSRSSCSVSTPNSRCSWTGSVSLTARMYSDDVKIHVYVVDSRIAHLEDIHKQPQCSFETSWQNFSERHNGSHHQVLTAAWNAAVFFLLVSVVCTGIVLRRFIFFVESGKLLSRLIVLKFIVQDMPQQLSIAAYLYGWYAKNGLRCQMCLFHPDHCDDEYPLHFSNMMLCLFTLLSASSNQLLIQMKAKSPQMNEEEELFQCCVRFSLLSVSSLPFSTATMLLANTVLNLHNVWIYLLAGVPTIFGWSTCLCLPLAAALEDDF